MILGYPTWQLKRFVASYIVDYDANRASLETDINVDDVSKLLINQDVIALFDNCDITKDDIKEGVIQWISDGKTLRDYCRLPFMPTFVTIYNWLESDKTFHIRFAHARDTGHDVIAQECLYIADNQLDAVELEMAGGKRITKKTVKDALGHRKLQIETRLKLLAKWNPTKYGDVIRQQLTGKNDGPIETVDKTPLNEKELARRIAFMLQKGAKSDVTTE